MQTRKKFEVEEAWIALQAFKESKSEVDLHTAYEALDEVVEICLRLAFARCPDRNLLDDLRQAARLKLFNFLPKMAEICDGSEYYFRLSMQVARRAMLTEYSKLKKQSYQEVNIYEASANRGGEHEDNIYNAVDTLEFEALEKMADPFVVMNQEFGEFEQKLLLNQTTKMVFDKAKEKLVKVFKTSDYKQAAVFTLLVLIKGHEPSLAWLQDIWGVKNPQELIVYVTAVWRDTVQEQGNG